MTRVRSYSMSSRAASAEATRARIVEAAAALFLSRHYDEVTIAGVARDAGVSGQTVLNHFGGKEQLFRAAVEHASDELRERRFRASPGDVRGAVEILVDDYEINGDATIRLLAAEDRMPAVRDVMDIGRAGHREWVETVFPAGAAVTAELVVVTDVYAWKLLRRDQGLSRDETVAAIRRMVEGLLP